MEYVFDDWKKILTDFQNSVSKDLEEIHKQKIEVQKMKSDIFNRLDSGKYIRDEQRIVLSAPEIIIGNVDKSGDLVSGGHIVIRGTDVNLEGAGKTGTVMSRATNIVQTAVDPGTDGMENVVYPQSSISQQARSISLESNNAKDAFSTVPPLLGESGIHIHADRTLDLESSISSVNHKASVEAQLSQLKKQEGDLKKLTSSQKQSVEKLFDNLKKLMDKEEKLNGDPFMIRSNTVDVEDIHEEIQATLPVLYRAMTDFIHNVAQQAEVSRKAKALEAEKNAIKSGDDFKKKSTGAQLSLTSESINVGTLDGDGNLRTNPGAGISVKTPQMGISMRKEDGTLVEKSSFKVQSENVTLTTGNPKADASEVAAAGRVHIASQDIMLESVDYQLKNKKYTEKGLAANGKVSITAKTVEVNALGPSNIERDDKGKVTKGEYKAEGDVTIRTKTMAVETLDYEVKDGKLSPKTLTKDSKIQMRTETATVMAADTEGKATGSISLNAKAINVKSMDVDKEKLEDKSLAAGSTMVLVSEKMYLGQKTSKEKSKKLQAVSEEMGLFADKTFEAQQDGGKATVQLSGGNASVGGSKTQVYGDTTINAKTEVKGELKAPSGTFDNVKAGTSFKSPNISDGMGAPGAGGGGSLSAKLKVEDAK